jgi:hypothetical protein
MDLIPLHENILIYSGEALCIIASLYIAFKHEMKAGLLLLFSFLMIFQASHLVFYLVGGNHDLGACIGEGKSYHDCLSWQYKLSTHAGQAGFIFLAISVLLLSKGLKDER